MSNPQNNIRFDPIQNKLLQSEYKICVEEGNNDTDTVDERMTKLGYTKDAVDVTRYNHSDGRQAIGVCLRQTLNSGAYHPVFNPSGCRKFITISDTQVTNWHGDYGKMKDISSAADCFNIGDYNEDKKVHSRTGGIAVGLSGRPSSFPDAYYDAVYAHQIFDLRITAHKQDVNKLREDAMLKAVAGKTRGWGKVPFTRVQKFPVMRSGFYGGYYYVRVTTGDTVIFPYTTATKVEGCYLQLADGTLFHSYEAHSTYENTGIAQAEFKISRISGSGEFVNGEEVTVVYANLLTPQNDTPAWTDLVGSPSAISATFPNGVQGMWIPITLPYTDFPLNVKANSSNSTTTYTSNNGNTWESTFISIDSIKNICGSASNPDEVRLIQYPTLANFTEPAKNSKVVGEVGDVHCGNWYLSEQGNRLYKSVAEVVAKSTTHPIRRDSKLTGLYLNADYCLDSVLDVYSPTHTPITLAAPANNSPAVKALSTITEKDGLLYLQYHGRELHYDATAANWGDNSTIPIVDGDGTMTDDNGHTVKTFCHHGMMPLGIASHSDSSQSKD